VRPAVKISSGLVAVFECTPRDTRNYLWMIILKAIVALIQVILAHHEWKSFSAPVTRVRVTSRP
jgi:hypothetical protein